MVENLPGTSGIPQTMGIFFLEILSCCDTIFPSRPVQYPVLFIF